MFLKWNCSEDFIADFDTDDDITLLKCKIFSKYTASPIRTEAQSHNLCGQILDSILSYVDDETYVHKANVYNDVNTGSLHDWTKKKFELADTQGTSTIPISTGSIGKTLEKGQKTIDLTIKVKANKNYIYI